MKLTLHQFNFKYHYACFFSQDNFFQLIYFEDLKDDNSAVYEFSIFNSSKISAYIPSFRQHNHKNTRYFELHNR